MNTRIHGQVLLIGLMLIALVTTIVGTGALRSVSSTQTTKQKEEANKASNIAKGALEAGINNETVEFSDFTDANPTGYAQSTAPTTIADQFVYNEIVPKDHQYMFYLGDYDSGTNTFGSNYFTGNLTVYYASDDTTCPLLELIQINNDDQIAERTYTAPSSTGCEGKNLNYPGAIAPGDDSGGNLNWDGQTITFNHSITLTIGANMKLLVIRPFFEGTKLGFSTDTDMALKPQGREVSSTVRTIDGAQRTERVYQAYPQIPLSLFATVL